MVVIKTASAFLLLILSSVSFAADWKSNFIASLHNGGALVKDENGKILFSHRADEHFIPASTIKIATSACALYHLGPYYRFETEFYITPNDKLGVKGYGDPQLISEELMTVAKELKSTGNSGFKGIIVDSSYFSPNIVIDGVSSSSNPYDALNSALLVNFNTINIKKLKNGAVLSAEPQTPLTPLANEMARKLKSGTHRINLANNVARSHRYAGELLAAFLEKEGVVVVNEISEGIIPEESRLILRHQSSLPLTEVVRGLLEFSTNLTANQLFLVMGAKQFGPPATVEKGIQVLSRFLKNEVGWNDFQLAEGSGLSRKTKVTSVQMMNLLEYFKPYRDFLPIHDDFFHAKTGTLNGVNTYAGYFPLSNGNRAKFVIMVNDQVPFNHKFQLAKTLYNYFNNL